MAIAGIAAAAGGGLAAASVLRSEDQPPAPAGPTSATYSGSASGQIALVLTITNQAGAGIGGCTTTRAYNGTITLNLQTSGDTVTGSAANAGNIALVSENCAIPFTGSAWFPWQIPVSGTTARFTGSIARAINFQAVSGPNQSNIPGTETTTLEGSVSQGVVTLAVTVLVAAQGPFTQQNGLQTTHTWSGNVRMPTTLR